MKRADVAACTLLISIICAFKAAASHHMAFLPFYDNKHNLQLFASKNKLAENLLQQDNARDVDCLLCPHNSSNVSAKFPSSSLLRTKPFEYHSTHSTSSDSNTTQNSHSHQTLLSNLVIDQTPQTIRLQVRRLFFQQQIIIPPCFTIVSKLVVAKCKVIETFSSTLRRSTEYFAQQTNAKLLVVACIRLYETLQGSVSHVRGVLECIPKHS